MASKSRAASQNIAAFLRCDTVDEERGKRDSIDSSHADLKTRMGAERRLVMCVSPTGARSSVGRGKQCCTQTFVCVQTSRKMDQLMAIDVCSQRTAGGGNTRMKVERMKVVGYIRVSTEEQVDSGLSLES